MERAARSTKSRFPEPVIQTSTQLVVKHHDRHNPLDGPVTGPKITRTTRPDDSIEIARRCAVSAACPSTCNTTLSSGLSAHPRRHPRWHPAAWRLVALLTQLSCTALHCSGDDRVGVHLVSRRRLHPGAEGVRYC